jgi:hypothetical protein
MPGEPISIIDEAFEGAAEGRNRVRGRRQLFRTEVDKLAEPFLASANPVLDLTPDRSAVREQGLPTAAAIRTLVTGERRDLAA